MSKGIESGKGILSAGLDEVRIQRTGPAMINILRTNVHSNTFSIESEEVADAAPNVKRSALEVARQYWIQPEESVQKTESAPSPEVMVIRG